MRYRYDEGRPQSRVKRQKNEAIQDHETICDLRAVQERNITTRLPLCSVHCCMLIEIKRTIKTESAYRHQSQYRSQTRRV